MLSPEEEALARLKLWTITLCSSLIAEWSIRCYRYYYNYYREPKISGDLSPRTGGDKKSTSGELSPSTSGDKSPRTGGDNSPSTSGLLSPNEDWNKYSSKGDNLSPEVIKTYFTSYSSRANALALILKHSRAKGSVLGDNKAPTTVFSPVHIISSDVLKQYDNLIGEILLLDTDALAKVSISRQMAFVSAKVLVANQDFLESYVVSKQLVKILAELVLLHADLVVVQEFLDKDFVVQLNKLLLEKSFTTQNELYLSIQNLWVVEEEFRQEVIKKDMLRTIMFLKPIYEDLSSARISAKLANLFAKYFCEN